MASAASRIAVSSTYRNDRNHPLPAGQPSRPRCTFARRSIRFRRLLARGGLLDDLDAELLDAVPQRALGDAEQLGGLDLDAVGLLQRVQDEAALDALELLVERGRD